MFILIFLLSRQTSLFGSCSSFFFKYRSLMKVSSLSFTK